MKQAKIAGRSSRPSSLNTVYLMMAITGRWLMVGALRWWGWMTQDRYMSRGRVHTQVAELLDRAVAINDE